MSVTAEQGAQAEAERQRRADMVQPLINEVRRLGAQQNNNLQEIHRLGTPVIQCDYCFLKSEEDAPMIRVLIAADAVCTQMVAIPLEKKGNHKSQSGSSRTIRRTSRGGHSKRLGARTYSWQSSQCTRESSSVR